MPDSEDERFESYLKQFRPLEADALPAQETRPAPRRHFVFAIYAAGIVMALVIVAVTAFRVPNPRGSGEPKQSAAVNRLGPTPLTMQRANALLAKAPSVKAAMDELAFPAASSAVPKDKQSALAVLSKEKIKL